MDLVLISDRYLKTTHAPTHVQYKLKINSILKIARPSEDAFQKEFQAVSNHKVHFVYCCSSR